MKTNDLIGEFDEQFLLKLKLGAFKEMIEDPGENLEELKSALIKVLATNEDEKTAIETQLDLANNKGYAIARTNDGTWNQRAERALAFRKKNITKLQRMLYLLNEKHKRMNIVETKKLFDYSRLFRNVCKHTLDAQTFERLDQITKEVFDIFSPMTEEDYHNFIIWKNAFLEKNPGKFEYLKIVELYRILGKRL